jgi:3-oxoadipate enol-lactonase
MNGAGRSGFVATDDGCRIFYRVDGAESAPPILFLNSLGTTHAMWDAQLPYLTDRFRVLRYDGRGHGASAVPLGPYSIARLAADAIAVLDAAGVERAVVCGLSLGGVVAQCAGTQHGERIAGLVLANTAALIGSAESWNDRIRTVTAGGVRAVRDAVLERWFTPDFRAADPAEVARIGAMLDATSTNGYVANCAAIRDSDQRDALRTIAAPTLVIVGSSDPVTPPADGEFIAAHIPGARIVTLEAAHLSNVERPAEFARAVREALDLTLRS